MIAEREDRYRTCCSTFSQEWCCSFTRGRRKEDWTQVRSNLLVPIPLNQRGMPGARFPFKTPDLLENGTEACGQTTCCSSLHFHTQISFLTFLHPFCPTSALSFHLTTRTVTNPAFPTVALLAHEVMSGKYTFCHLLSTVAASHPWWGPEGCQPSLAPLSFTFSVEGVAVPRQPPSAPVLPPRGATPQPGQGPALHGVKAQGGPPSAQAWVTGVWLLSEAQIN